MSRMTEEPVYTPRAEYQCDGSTTHYQGCKCHESRRQAEATQLREHLAVARECLEWLESGLAGMFGTQSKSARDEFYEMAPKVVHDCLARIGGGKVECKHCDDELPGAHRCPRKTAARMRVVSNKKPPLGSE